MLRKIVSCLALILVLLGLQPTLLFAASVPAAQPDKGLVVFYRAKSFKGGAVHMNVRSSEGSAGILKSGTMFYHYYEPGQKTFDVSTPSIAGSDLITINIEAGKTYYVRGEILMGWPAGRPSLTQENESKALQDIGKL